jgi:aryl-alcohol dehydrogenase-like predicted oxidoreductase
VRSVNLGSSGLEVSALGFGAMGLSGVYGTADDSSSTEVLRRAVELGINFFDTADIYGAGHNERLVGNALRHQRESLILATKFGGGSGPDGQYDGLARPELVAPYLHESLDRLGTDYVDLYYLHRADPATPIEETVGAMAELVRQGLVRHLGLSEVSASTLARAHAVHPITALQTEYSLFAREAEAESLPAAVELGIGFVAYSPLGRGFLSGEIKGPQDIDSSDWRSTVPRYQGESLGTAVVLAQALAEIAAQHDAVASQVALAWLLGRRESVVPIPGTRSVTHLEANVAALDISLSTQDVNKLEQLFALGALPGDRVPPESMRRINL